MIRNRLQVHECKGEYQRPTLGLWVVRVADDMATWWTLSSDVAQTHRIPIRWCPYCGERLSVPADVAGQYEIVYAEVSA